MSLASSSPASFVDNPLLLKSRNSRCWIETFSSAFAMHDLDSSRRGSLEGEIAPSALFRCPLGGIVTLVCISTNHIHFATAQISILAHPVRKPIVRSQTLA